MLIPLKSNFHLPKKSCLICFNESLFKSDKKLQFIFKAFFVLKIYYCPDFFLNTEKLLDKKTKVNCES